MSKRPIKPLTLVKPLTLDRLDYLCRQEDIYEPHDNVLVDKEYALNEIKSIIDMLQLQIKLLKRMINGR